ncbi:hypothetical protein Bbelb_157220 [Branchiostoma belcheri]|nr:hypothetical protein Bbelb_157220 [Branchiostoma belcheri]
MPNRLETVLSRLETTLSRLETMRKDDRSCRDDGRTMPGRREDDAEPTGDDAEPNVVGCGKTTGEVPYPTGALVYLSVPCHEATGVFSHLRSRVLRHPVLPGKRAEHTCPGAGGTATGHKIGDKSGLEPGTSWFRVEHSAATPHDPKHKRGFHRGFSPPLHKSAKEATVLAGGVKALHLGLSGVGQGRAMWLNPVPNPDRGSASPGSLQVLAGGVKALHLGLSGVGKVRAMWLNPVPNPDRGSVSPGSLQVLAGGVMALQLGLSGVGQGRAMWLNPVPNPDRGSASPGSLQVLAGGVKALHLGLSGVGKASDFNPQCEYMVLHSAANREGGLPIATKKDMLGKTLNQLP